MRKCHLTTAAALSLFVLAGGVFGREAVERQQRLIFRPEIGLEYFSRTIGWDETQTSKLKSFLVMAATQFELVAGLELGILAGYSSSNFDGLFFRKLPFSIEFEGGGISGYLLGAELQKRFALKTFELGLSGQFLSYLGTEQEWKIPGLNVEGKIKSHPAWYRIVAGPALAYKGIDYFSPYISVTFNKLWGSFEMRQNIQTLTGLEKKSISGKSLFGVSLGAAYEFTDFFSFQGEAGFLPYSGGVDTAFKARAVFIF